MHTHIYQVPIDFEGRANVEVAVHRGLEERDEYEILNVDMDVPGVDTLDDKIAFLDSHVDDLKDQILDYIREAL